jgi:uncharacterized membrane protein HdeD (DUF308 family)
MTTPPGKNAASGSVDDVPLLDMIADHRALLLGRGIAAIAFAFLAFFWPRLTVVGLTILWGSYSSVDGALALTAAVRSKAGTRAWLSLIGLSGLACAIAVLMAAHEVAAHLAVIVSLWAGFAGTMYLWVALRLRKAVQGNWVLALDGIGIITFGLALAFWPHPGLEALVWLTGWFAALLGSLLLYARISIAGRR